MECLTDFEHIEVEIKAVADEAAAERLILQLHQDLKVLKNCNNYEF
jgi:glycerophosphoryl diester phosphodiesterase